MRRGTSGSGARISVAEQSTLRGAGLGNEIIPLAKAYIAARELGLTLAKPRWSGNRYHLASHFGWSPPTLLAENLWTYRLPQVRVTEDLFRATGETDYGKAVVEIADRLELRSQRRVALVHGGMWGGYLAIHSARNYVRQLVLGAPGVAERLDQLDLPSHDEVVVAVHVRLGDFSSLPVTRGAWNRLVPLSWYRDALVALGDVLGDRRWRCLVVSDGSRKALAPIVDLPNVEVVSSSSVLGDLAVLASADLLVCSASSFSMTASFLSNSPYLWHEPQLAQRGSALSFWGGEASEQGPDSLTSRNATSLAPAHLGRGIPFRSGAPLPEGLSHWLTALSPLRGRERDLVLYGVVNAPPELETGS
jgi:hypothetical protein